MMTFTPVPIKNPSRAGAKNREKRAEAHASTAKRPKTKAVAKRSESQGQDSAALALKATDAQHTNRLKGRKTHLKRDGRKRAPGGQGYFFSLSCKLILEDL
jgi:phage repressor protein C with HTH and peptisase S24 domain